MYLNRLELWLRLIDDASVWSHYMYLMVVFYVPCTSRYMYALHRHHSPRDKSKQNETRTRVFERQEVHMLCAVRSVPSFITKSGIIELSLNRQRH